jgi:hypothetical protein
VKIALKTCTLTERQLKLVLDTNLNNFIIDEELNGDKEKKEKDLK